MSELHDLLERRAGEYLPPPDLLPRVQDRARRRERNRRTASALAGLLIVAVAAGGLFRMLQPTTAVVFDPPTNVWSGTWVSIDTDGSSQTMTIRSVDGGTYEIVVADDGATVCSGAPSTMRGTGQFDDTGLVVPTPRLTCDDGSTPETTDGSSLEDALRDYTLVHHTETDTLADSRAVTWRRPGTAPDAAVHETPAGMWPQSTLDEVRQAQERADAGDPAYTWQVEPAIGDVGGDAEIFARFLTEELGWDGFRWGAESDSGAMHWGGSDTSPEIDFVRCAAGELNNLYSDDPAGRRCAPTLGEYEYETVRVSAYRPVDDGPGGVLVIKSSRTQPPFRQAAPPSSADIAEAVEPFLRARVKGEGAAQHLSTEATEIPLLYAASDGARYDRFDYEVVQGPIWPFGTVLVKVRLFADGGETVVEQTFSLEQGALVYASREQPTTEDGSRVGEPYTVPGGQVTFSVPTALGSWQDLCCFTPAGEDMEGVQGYLGDFGNEFVVVVDPLPPAGQCGVGDQPVSADELVRRIRSNRNLSVTAQAVRVGGVDATRLEVTSVEGASTCSQALDARDEGIPVLAPRPSEGDPQWYGLNPDNKAHLYVFDLPGDRERTVAIVIRGPRSTFDQLLKGADEILESLQLNPE